MASKQDHLDFCLSTVTIKTKMGFEEDHLDFCLATVTIKNNMLFC